MITPNITPSATNIIKARVGIIDDDPIAATVMRARLRILFPECSITIYDKPVVEPHLDVYFVDNDFGGNALATELLREIRKLNPDALVVAMSATLRSHTLKDLMNGGCNAVYDKNQSNTGDPVFEVMANYLKALSQTRSTHTRTPFTETVLSVRDLLHKWNQRLRRAGF
ncbi:MAG: hypothetical protein ACPGES_05810 [Coraliomargarita sp.]